MTCLTKYQNKKEKKIHEQDIKVCFAKHTLSKSSLGWLGLGPDTAHSPFYLYTRLYLALFTFLLYITINNHTKMFFSFLFFLLASVRELFTHACYRRRVIKMQGGGELKVTCLFLQRP